MEFDRQITHELPYFVPLDNAKPDPIFDLMLRLKAQINSGTPVDKNTLILFANNKYCSDNDGGLMLFNDDDGYSQPASAGASSQMCAHLSQERTTMNDHSSSNVSNCYYREALPIL